MVLVITTLAITKYELLFSECRKKISVKNDGFFIKKMDHLPGHLVAVISWV